MSAAELRDTRVEGRPVEGTVGSAVDGPVEGTDDPGTSLSVAPDAVEVRRNAGLAAGVGATASAVAIAYLARAVQTGALVDWVLVTVMGALGVSWLATFVDARTPLLVADGHGVRMRLGRTWRGLPWSAVQRVEHTPRRGLLGDGRLAVVARNPEKVLSELDPAGLRRARLAARLHGEPFAVPLGLSTRVVGGGDDVQVALERVAARAAEVVMVEPAETAGAVVARSPSELEPESGLAETVERAVEHSDEHPGAPLPRVRDPRPSLAALIARLATLLPARGGDPAGEVRDGLPEEAPEQAPEQASRDHRDATVTASATPSPLREGGAGRRSEVRRDLPADVRPEVEPAGRELRRPGNVSLVEETQVWGERVRPIARQGEAVEPLVLDDFAIEPADDPVVGPEIVAARTRLGLSVDQLAERTRIRPHVIESIEVDDFVPCGGDFYARGHLRTLARILGVDATPLLAAYDERYAHAPINPRRVFEAELATGASGSIRSTRGGPNWSVLVAVVMAMVLCWSVARLVMDTPTDLRGATPVLNGSGGPDGAAAAVPVEPVGVSIDAPAGGAHVVVREGSGQIVYKGNLAAGDVRELEAAPPVRVQSTDGAVTVGLDGQAARPIGEPGVAGQGTFVPR